MIQSNKHNLKIGDKVTFTNKLSYTMVFTISRTSEKSVWNKDNNGEWRDSWNTMNKMIDDGATIERT